MRFPSAQFPALQTARLLLVELQQHDAEELFSIRTNEEINRFIGRSSNQSMDDVRQFIAARQQDFKEGKGVYWGIKLKETGQLIGTSCFWNLDHTANSTEMGYELLPSHQGKGFMTEALKEVIDFAFGQMKLGTIAAWVTEQNERSIKSLTRFDFVYTETIDGLLVYKLDKAIGLSKTLT
jgi:ribosomal-protein-alanine N-acetyltransferase